MGGDGEGDSWSGALAGLQDRGPEEGPEPWPDAVTWILFEESKCGRLGMVHGGPGGDTRLHLPLESCGACGCPRLLGGMSRSHGLVSPGSWPPHSASLALAQVLAAAAVLVQQVTRAPGHPDGSLGDPWGPRAAARSCRAWPSDRSPHTATVVCMDPRWGWQQQTGIFQENSDAPFFFLGPVR